MGLYALILCVIPVVWSITIMPNGNSPEIKMRRGMTLDLKKGPLVFNADAQKKSEKTIKINGNNKLSINERYRRLIPYMTFYYANDLQHQTPPPEPVHNIEVEKAEIIEAQTLAPNNDRQSKKLIMSHVPRYQGNRLTEYNIASANPNKLRKGSNHHYNILKYPSHDFAPQFHNVPYEFDRYVQQPQRHHIAPYSHSTRKPHIESSENDQIYVGEKSPKFKLIPYEQTPPVKVVQQHDHHRNIKNPVTVPVLVRKEPTYKKSRHPTLQFHHEIQFHANPPMTTLAPVPPVTPRKHPSVVSESYYNRRPQVQPYLESGFKPIVPYITSEAPVVYPKKEDAYVVETDKPPIKIIEDIEPKYEDNSYFSEQPTLSAQFASNKLNLGDLINSLQGTNTIPKTITKENVGDSIKTLLQVLNALRAEQNDVDTKAPELSSPKPFVATGVHDDREKIGINTPSSTPSAVSAVTATDDLHSEPYLAQVNTPSQYLDEYTTGGGSTQHFPPPVYSDEEGGTPGTPGVDYPILTSIPQTSFNCKTQRYKGFFADPETRCQVWHYCDLNGGQASFLCPNGTIFSQAALTCDWWFNVKCSSTTQLYVLNESLYKFILPHSPKFPEDYSGPLVDKYLTLKFKEMEEQFKKNKSKQNASEKVDSESTEAADAPEESTEESVDEKAVSEPSVVVESPGTSGNVQRLEEK